MPPQMPPPQPNAAAQGAPPPEQGGGVQELVEGIHTDMMKFLELVQESAPQVAQKLEAVVQAFQLVVQELVSGGGGKPQGAPPGQPSAGGPGSVPM